MDLPGIILLSGLLYIVLFGGLSWLRREGLPTRLAVEALVLTLLAVGLVTLTGADLHPAIFLFGLYLLTMRVRIAVDIANVFARRQQFGRASAIYDLAARLFPDKAGRAILDINRGILALQAGDQDSAVRLLEGVVQQADQGMFGVKHEAAAHYNLGVALLRKGQKSRATIEFNKVMDILPASEYARRAEAALVRARKAG